MELPRIPLQKIGIVSVLFFCISLVVYGSSLSNNFVTLDDPYVIYNNLAIREITPSTIKTIFTTYDPELYTPLTFFTFQLNYLMGGLEPFWYHATNLFLHTINALLVASLLAALLGSGLGGLLGGLLFLLHPVNTEVVAWATARKEVLSTLFLLLSITTYLWSHGSRRKIYWLSVFLFLLGLLSKVNIFVLPFLLLLIDWLQIRPINKKMFIDKIPYAVLSVVFVLIGIIPKSSILSSTTLSEKILMGSKSTVFYLWKFIAPINLSILYPHEGIISFSSISLLVSFIGLLLILTAVINSLRWTRKIAFGFLFFFVGVAPTFVHFNRNASIALKDSTGVQFASDHYLYFPVFGLIFLVILSLTYLWNKQEYSGQLQKKRGIIAVCASLVLLLFASLSYAQAAHWKNSETLFTHVLKLYPYSTASRTALSVIYRKTGRLEDEKKILEDGLIFGRSAKLLTGLASIAARNGDIVSADKYYDEAIAADPTYSEPYFGKGVMLLKQGKRDEAFASYNKAIELDPVYVAAYNNLGSMMHDEGNNKEAERYFLKAISINKASVEGQFNLGTVYREQGRNDEAMMQFEIALQLDSSLNAARLELSTLYLEKGRNSDAFAQVRNVLEHDPENDTAKGILNEMIKLGIIGTK